MAMRIARTGLAVAFGALGVVAAASTDTSYEVKWAGEMRRVMHDGDVSASVVVADLPLEHLYALGPLEGLRGEVTVWDGRASVARMKGGKIDVTDAAKVGACFLVYANVGAWQPVEIPGDVVTGPDLEAFVARAAAGRRIDVERPFPFRIEAIARRAAFHVVNKTDNAPHSREEHERIKVKAEVTGEAIKVIGFHSTAHHGVFTHHDSDVHMHLIAGDGGRSGHVDALSLAPGGTLFLPR